jgi:hypothetical protein
MRLLLVGLLLVGGGGSAVGRTLEVGAGLAYAVPSEAAAVAVDGDTVSIAPGQYFDCSVWRANGLSIVGSGPGVVITDRACEGKAEFVIAGDGVTVRGLTFARIRVPDGNGAGIRLEGRGLAVEDSRFVNNQMAVLAGGHGGALRISGSYFGGNGAATSDHPLFAVLAGSLDLLRVEHSVFEGARGGGHVGSSARLVELVDDRFSDEGGGMSGPLVSVSGGSLLLEGSTVTLGPLAAERVGAVLVLGSVGTVEVRGNRLVEASGGVALVRNWSGAVAVSADNVVPEGVVAVSDEGAGYHRLRAEAAAARAAAGGLAGAVRHRVGEMARGLRLIP